MSKTLYTTIVKLIGEFEPDMTIIGRDGPIALAHAVTLYLGEDGRVLYLGEKGVLKTLDGEPAPGVVAVQRVPQGGRP